MLGLYLNTLDKDDSMQFKLLQYGVVVVLLLLGGCNPTPQSYTSPPAQVIKLTQTGCQSLDTEAEDFKYQTSQADDCKKINAETLDQRQPGFKPLTTP